MVAREPDDVQLCEYVARTASDPEFKKWAADVRQMVRSGIAEEELLGRDALEELKRAATARP